MNLDSLDSLRAAVTASSTTFGLIVLSRLFPSFDRMMEHRSATLRVAYDLCLAMFLTFTLSCFFTGLGFA